MTDKNNDMVKVLVGILVLALVLLLVVPCLKKKPRPTAITDPARNPENTTYTLAVQTASNWLHLLSQRGRRSGPQRRACVRAYVPVCVRACVRAVRALCVSRCALCVVRRALCVCACVRCASCVRGRACVSKYQNMI